MSGQPRACTMLTVAGVCGVLAIALAGWTPGNQAEAALPALIEQSGVAVNGVGSVWVKPDVAKINLGVSATATTVAAARTSAAETMQSVQAALATKGVAERDIQTQYVNISPQYSTLNRAQPTITGYIVNNVVEVTVRNIDASSEALDAAVAAGGNAVRVNGISFTIDRPEQFMSQAREAAARDARGRAEVLARAAGISLGRPRSIVESGGNVPIPFAPRASAAAPDGGAPTPINPGEQRVEVSISMVFDIN